MKTISGQTFYTVNREAISDSKETAVRQLTKMTNRWEGVQKSSKIIKNSIISNGVIVMLSKYTQVRKGWVVNCIFCLKVIELFLSVFYCLRAGVCLFSEPLPLLLCELQYLGVIPSGCQLSSLMEAESWATDALISWKTAPRMTSDFLLRLISSISACFADLQASISEHTESVTTGR